MTEDEGDDVRVWMVGREYTDKGLVTLTYATQDGERVFVQQRSAANLGEVTAGKTVEADRLAPTDEGNKGAYATEAERMAERHDPDDAV